MADEKGMSAICKKCGKPLCKMATKKRIEKLGSWICGNSDKVKVIL